MNGSGSALADGRSFFFFRKKRVEGHLPTQGKASWVLVGVGSLFFFPKIHRACLAKRGFDRSQIRKKKKLLVHNSVHTDFFQ